MCLKDIEQYEQALELLDFIEKLSDQIAEVYTIRADIYKLTGRNSLMEKELEKAYKFKPELRTIFKKEDE
jgi:tetratricopeptide (TPR) repeat protein